MKIHHLLAAALFTVASPLVMAHPGGHDDQDGPSREECAQVAKLSKAEAETPAMKELKRLCEAPKADDGAKKKGDKKPAN